MKSIYLIGALKNWDIVDLANELTKQNFDVFCDWITPGPEADTFLLKYAKQRGWSYKQALESHAAKHVFEFDKSHLDRCDIAIAVAPFGKSAMLELGYTIGKGKPGYILFPEEPERFDVMLQFATGIYFNRPDLFKELDKYQWTDIPNAVTFGNGQSPRCQSKYMGGLQCEGPESHFGQHWSRDLTWTHFCKLPDRTPQFKYDVPKMKYRFVNMWQCQEFNFDAQCELLPGHQGDHRVTELGQWKWWTNISNSGRCENKYRWAHGYTSQCRYSFGHTGDHLFKHEDCQ